MTVSGRPPLLDSGQSMGFRLPVLTHREQSLAQGEHLG